MKPMNDWRDEPEPVLTFEGILLLVQLLAGGAAGLYVGIAFLRRPNAQNRFDDLVLGLVIILVGLFWVGICAWVLGVRYRRNRKEWRQYYASARVVARWTGTPPTVNDLLALRRIKPEFAALTVDEVRNRVGESESWEIGVYPYNFAKKQIKEPAKGLGLRIDLIEIESPKAINEHKL
jgi:hypothetical protein